MPRERYGRPSAEVSSASDYEASWRCAGLLALRPLAEPPPRVCASPLGAYVISARASDEVARLLKDGFARALLGDDEQLLVGRSGDGGVA
jgi:hypothetical protein